VFGGARDTTIGGTVAGAGNVIAGNTVFGVAIGYAATRDNVVAGNLIGRLPGGAAAPNGSEGLILYLGTHDNTIGGTAAGAGNVIDSNGWAGVGIYDADTRDNAVLGNSMRGNAGLGIDLVGGTQDGFGVTANDGSDNDQGPNRLQNHPVLTGVVTGGGTTTISGELKSKASSTFRVELFASSSPDPSTYGEGATYLGFVSVTTNGSGFVSFSFPTAALGGGQVVTATATDAAGNTSEFSRRKAA
jgi:hypothetical protein